jgi:ABC-type uncharacterized transport system substrate-binding protein
MQRRELIAGLGSALAWPIAARAQQSGRLPRVGVLTMFDENDREATAWYSSFTRRLAELDWREGQTVRFEVRWAAGDFDRLRMFAKELVDLQPDVIFAVTTPAGAAVHQETRAIPIVFVLVADPVSEGFVSSIARPGGNMTGFLNLEPSMGGKWLELLKEIAPSVKRAAIMFNPLTAPYVSSYFLPSFEEAARSFKVEPVTARVRSESEIDEAITALGRVPIGGLVTMPDSFMQRNRARIISLATKNNLPTVLNEPASVRNGGLLYYIADQGHEFLRAGSYVDRILRGAKPAELPVQLPTKFVTVVNLNTAKALGLTVPQSILLRADEVIE